MVYSTKIIEFIANELNNDVSIFKETPYYSNNPLLRKGNLVFDYTYEEMNEISKAYNDLEYFLSKYVSTSSGKMELFPYQWKLLSHQEENRFVTTMVSRQMGISTCQAIFLLHKIIKGKSVVIISQRTNGISLLDKIKEFYHFLPFYMKPGVTSWNQSSISFDNGSDIKISLEPAVRSFDVYYMENIGIQESKNEELMNHIYESVYPTVSARIGSQIIINSFPNDSKGFDKLWTDSKEGKNSFRPIEIKWGQDPSRDDKWKQEIIKSIGQEVFDKEYDLKFDSKK